LAVLFSRKKKGNDAQAVINQSLLSDDMIYEMMAIAATAVVNDLQSRVCDQKKQLENVRARQ
jgi:hypothetical protein